MRVVMGMMPKGIMPRGIMVVRGHGRTSHAVAANLASPPLRWQWAGLVVKTFGRLYIRKLGRWLWKIL
jgi:hypothetical protein